MAKMNKALEAELQSIIDAADSGLPKNLQYFAWAAAAGIRQMSAHRTFSKVELQSMVDTLHDLITTKVNSR